MNSQAIGAPFQLIPDREFMRNESIGSFSQFLSIEEHSPKTVHAFQNQPGISQRVIVFELVFIEPFKEFVGTQLFRIASNKQFRYNAGFLQLQFQIAGNCGRRRKFRVLPVRTDVFSRQVSAGLP